jgi:hypothetical protein
MDGWVRFVGGGGFVSPGLGEVGWGWLGEMDWGWLGRGRCWGVGQRGSLTRGETGWVRFVGGASCTDCFRTVGGVTCTDCFQFVGCLTLAGPRPGRDGCLGLLRLRLARLGALAALLAGLLAFDLLLLPLLALRLLVGLPSPAGLAIALDQLAALLIGIGRCVRVVLLQPVLEFQEAQEGVLDAAFVALQAQERAVVAGFEAAGEQLGP